MDPIEPPKRSRIPALGAHYVGGIGRRRGGLREYRRTGHPVALDVDTGSGRIDLGLRGDVRALRVSSGSGSVRVTVPASLGARIGIETASGAITCDLPLESARQRRHELTGPVGDGRGEVHIETASGRVELLAAGR